MKNSINKIVPIVIFILIIFGLVYLNKMIQGKVGQIIENPVTTTPIKPIVKLIKKEIPKYIPITSEVLCRTRLAPEKTFYHSTFYKSGQEIARHKESVKGLIYDQSGDIPNGKVKFLNETNES